MACPTIRRPSASTASLTPHGHLVRLLWRTLALMCVAFGLLGVVLPVLPTVPFMLAAAWAAGRGWPELELRLLNNRYFGPHIRRWREHGAVPRSAKWAASALMAFSAGLLFIVETPPWARVGVLLTLGVVAAWLWTRPEH
jgi:uncharacterized membrane protein YbaN (DUF454 family)